MSYFFWGTLILFFSTLIFYLVFFGLVYYWHEKKTTLVVVPLLYTFEFFLTAFFVISAISLVLQFLPQIISLLQTAGTGTL